MENYAIRDFFLSDPEKLIHKGEAPEANISVEWEEKWINLEDKETSTPYFIAHCGSLDEAMSIAAKLAFGITNSTKLAFDNDKDWCFESYEANDDETFFAVVSVEVKVES
tara:strand:- start:187 stop:516 length:330 start_codon:yes stop_codon:yes gene_type:complete